MIHEVDVTFSDQSQGWNGHVQSSIVLVKLHVPETFRSFLLKSGSLLVHSFFQPMEHIAIKLSIDHFSMG